MNIVHTWLETYKNPTTALDEINAALGTKFGTGSLTYWRKEEKGLTPQAFNFMLSRIVNNDQYRRLRMPDPKSPDK
jgi:hypothetical protein